MADPPIYHVTTYDRLESIAEEGLAPGNARAIGGTSYDAHSRGKVFLTDAEGVAFWYQRAEDHAEANSDDVLDDGMIPVVLRIDINAYTEDLDEDDIGTSDAGADAYTSREAAEPEYIAVWNGKRWLPIDEWEEIDPSVAVDDDGYFDGDDPLLPRL